MEIKVKMPGMLLEYTVQAGDKIQVGDIIAYHDALKMKRAILAPANATVVELCAPIKKRIAAGTTIMTINCE